MNVFNEKLREEFNRKDKAVVSRLNAELLQDLAEQAIATGYDGQNIMPLSYVLSCHFTDYPGVYCIADLSGKEALCIGLLRDAAQELLQQAA